MFAGLSFCSPAELLLLVFRWHFGLEDENPVRVERRAEDDADDDRPENVRPVLCEPLLNLQQERFFLLLHGGNFTPTKVVHRDQSVFDTDTPDRHLRAFSEEHEILH